jgi:hypothetical protein
VKRSQGLPRIFLVEPRLGMNRHGKRDTKTQKLLLLLTRTQKLLLLTKTQKLLPLTKTQKLLLLLTKIQKLLLLTKTRKMPPTKTQKLLLLTKTQKMAPTTKNDGVDVDEAEKVVVVTPVAVERAIVAVGRAILITKGGRMLVVTHLKTKCHRKKKPPPLLPQKKSPPLLLQQPNQRPPQLRHL